MSLAVLGPSRQKIPLNLSSQVLERHRLPSLCHCLFENLMPATPIPAFAAHGRRALRHCCRRGDSKFAAMVENSYAGKSDGAQPLN